MNGVESAGADVVFQSPALEYEYLDPAFWFDRIWVFIKFVLNALFNPTMGDLLQGIFYALAIFFITLICYCAVRMFEIRKKEHEHLHHEIQEYAHHQKEKERKAKEAQGVSRNPRWLRVLELISSTSVNDWKLAIVEADAMLDTMMKDMGFVGDSLGERLKSADRATFKSLTAAWEAHAVRNRIAHEGSAYDLSLHEGRRIIALYESIFREFGYI